MKLVARTAKWRLANLWLIACGGIILILILQSYGGLYGDRLQEAWGWLLPTVMPTLSLIVGILMEPGSESDDVPGLDRRQYRLAMALSLVYLLLIASSVVGAATLADQSPPINLLQRSNLWLGPIQGLVVIAIGVVFHAKKDE